MKKSQIVNLLYVLAVVVMLIGIVLQFMSENHEDGDISIGFWLGLLIYAFAELYKNVGKDSSDPEE